MPLSAWVTVMQTKGFAMLRKIVLAALLAALFSNITPALAASAEDASVSNINKTETADPAPIAVQESVPMQLAPEEAPSTLSPTGHGPNDSLSNFGPSSGTMVGNRALELRDEVLRLRSSVNLNASEFMVLRANGAAGAVQYHSTVAAITARLQNGTTRGNPILLRQWEEAEGSLNEVTSSLNRLNTLQTAVAADASLSSYMLESIQAGFLLSGAVDEDHDQLKLLRDEVSRLVVQLDYLRNQVAEDIQRQTTYLTTERSNLQTLAFAITRGELLGSSVANRPVVVNPSPVIMLPQAMQQGGSFAPSPAAAPAAPVTGGRLLGPAPMSPRAFMEEQGGGQTPPMARPVSDAAVAPTTGRLLVLIRYNKSNVDYEQQLAAAVSNALGRKPDAEFTVVSIVPVSGEPAEIATMQETANRNADGVKRSLVQLGLAPSRIAMSSAQTQDARTAEVHVYVR